MLKHLLCLCFGLSLLSGCHSLSEETPVATTENYKILLDEWLGHNKSSLYEVWGTPMNDYWKGNYNYIIYTKQSVDNASAGATIERMPLVARELSFYEKPQGLVTRSCTTLFKLEDGIIVSWKFEGNHCVAGPSQK